MYKKKPKVFITRRLPKKIETRMMELFDTTLNEKDVLLTEEELINYWALKTKDFSPLAIILMQSSKQI